MIALPDLGGWVKLHRGLLLPPVWHNEPAYRVYCSLLLRTTYQTITIAGAKLVPGQLLVSQTEIGELTGYSRKVIRSALNFLAKHNAISIHGHNGKAGTIFSVHSFPFCGMGELPDSADYSKPESRPVNGPYHNRIVNPVEVNSNFLPENTMEQWDDLNGAAIEDQFPTEYGPEYGPAINKDEEVEKIRTNPLPPLKKGAYGFSDSVSSVLGMWRESCAALDMAYVEDRKTIRGAESIATELLDTGAADTVTIRQGMINLLTMKKNDPKAKLYTLGTLCRNFSNFISGMNQTASTSTPPVSLVWWRWTCDVCHDCMSGKLPADAPLPEPIPCRVTRGCTGTMNPDILP